MADRLTFQQMWRLIQLNYNTYFGKYKALFSPELMAAIFFEESRFSNTTENGAGPAVGFGQVNRPEIPQVNLWFGTTFDTSGSDVLANDGQSVQLAGLTLAMLLEKQPDTLNVFSRRDNALRNYAGFPMNQDIPPRWLQTERMLKSLGMTCLVDVTIDLTLRGAIKNALNAALRPGQQQGDFDFFPTFPTLLGKWRVEVGSWTWIYVFHQDNTCDWRNIARPDHVLGRGTWFDQSTSSEIDWETGSVELWDHPLMQKGQTGTLRGQGKIISARQLR
jgi:hypothetical protein